MMTLYAGIRSISDWVSSPIHVPTTFIDFSFDLTGKNPSMSILDKYIATGLRTATIDNAGHFLLLQVNRYELVNALLYYGLVQ
jgi:hypothetical protein